MHLQRDTMSENRDRLDHFRIMAHFTDLVIPKTSLQVQLRVDQIIPLGFFRVGGT